MPNIINAAFLRGRLEYNEAFVKEFMPYLIADKSGKTTSEILIPQLIKSLEQARDGEQLYLEDKTDGR